MAIQSYNDPLYINWLRDSDTGLKKSTKITDEQHQIAGGIITLTLIPDMYYHVQIDGMYEILLGSPSESQFRVDYGNGEITFNPSLESQFITVAEYWGRGIIMYPDSRIYVTATGIPLDSTTLPQTLQYYLNSIAQFIYQYSYNSSAHYSANNMVYDSGSTWICKQACQGIQPSTDLTNTYWKPLAIGTFWDGTYNNSSPYNVMNIVTYNNGVYICISPTTGNLPTNTTYWQPILDATIVNNVLSATTAANNAATSANTAATSANTAAINANNLVNAYKVCVPYDNSVTYYQYNKVTYQGSTYQCIVASVSGVYPNTDNTKWLLIAAKGSDGAGGDMFKATYDSNNNGIVDNSEALNGHADTYFAKNSDLGIIANANYNTKTSIVNLLNANKTWLNVKDYGALGDGTTDDTTAILNAITALNTKNGGILFFPSGTYIISQTLVFSRYTTIKGEASHNTFIKCGSTFTATYNSMIVFRYPNNHCDCVSMYDIQILPNQKPVHAITGYSVYDSVIFQNIVVDTLNDNYHGFNLIPNETLTDVVSQTGILMNCLVYAYTNTATSSLFYLKACQEFNLIGCKGFSSRVLLDGTQINSIAPGFELEDCRGITSIGCSVVGGNLNVYAIKVIGITRAVNGITFIGNTFESCKKVLYCKGMNSSNLISNFYFYSNRNEGSGGGGDEFHLENMDSINVEYFTGTYTATQVTKAFIKSDQNIQMTNDLLSLFSNGVNVVQAGYPWNANMTGLALLLNNGSTTYLRQVEIGAIDSGGTGYRILRVQN